MKNSRMLINGRIASPTRERVFNRCGVVVVSDNGREHESISTFLPSLSLFIVYYGLIYACGRSAPSRKQNQHSTQLPCCVRPFINPQLHFYVAPECSHVSPECLLCTRWRHTACDHLRSLTNSYAVALTHRNTTRNKRWTKKWKRYFARIGRWNEQRKAKDCVVIVGMRHEAFIHEKWPSTSWMQTERMTWRKISSFFLLFVDSLPLPLANEVNRFNRWHLLRSYLDWEVRPHPTNFIEFPAANRAFSSHKQ